MIRYVAAAILLALLASNAAAQTCKGNPVAVQVLGSGAPLWVKDRADTSYLLWVGSQAKVLVDAGSGAYLRYGQAGAKFSDLSMTLISHLHPDHVSDLPGIIWPGREIRTEPLPVIGPSGDNRAPSLSVFFNRLFDSKTGAFQVLGSIMDAGPGTKFVPDVVDVTKPEPSTVFDRDGIKVTALGVPHNIPSLAYRVEARGRSVVFGSDQDGTNPRFVDFSKGADVLIFHLGNLQRNRRFATPTVVGRIAQEAHPGRLILSHIPEYPDPVAGDTDLDAAIADVKRNYTGPLTVGADLQCTPV
jgi:ribonuclease BN (tRNA processing enzyme)